MDIVVDIEKTKQVYIVSALYHRNFVSVVENVTKREAIKICDKYKLENQNNPEFIDCFVGKRIL